MLLVLIISCCKSYERGQKIKFFCGESFINGSEKRKSERKKKKEKRKKKKEGRKKKNGGNMKGEYNEKELRTERGFRKKEDSWQLCSFYAVLRIFYLLSKYIYNIKK